MLRCARTFFGRYDLKPPTENRDVYKWWRKDIGLTQVRPTLTDTRLRRRGRGEMPPAAAFVAPRPPDGWLDRLLVPLAAPIVDLRKVDVDGAMLNGWFWAFYSVVGMKGIRRYVGRER